MHSKLVRCVQMSHVGKLNGWSDDQVDKGKYSSVRKE